MRTLVTGAEGFVGGYVLDALLAQGHEVFGGSLRDVAADAPGTGAGEGNIRWLELDVTDSALLPAVIREVRPEWVVHLAAQSSVRRSLDEPVQTWEVNATGTLRLVTALWDVAPSARVLIVSSAEVYGAVPPDQQPISEARLLAPTTPYGASKAAAEMAALQMAARGLRVIVARSFNHTGRGQSASFALPGFARQLKAIARGDGEACLGVGNLDVRRDFLDVRDVVAAYLLLLERGLSGTVYNVCSGSAPTLRELVERLIAIAGGHAEIRVEPHRLRAADIPVLQGDCRRLRELGWEPRHSTTDMLAALYEAA